MINEVQPCLKAPSEDGEACTPAEIRKNPTPAYAAGIEVGDRFVSFNGEPIEDWGQVRSLIRDSGDEVVVPDFLNDRLRKRGGAHRFLRR